MAIKISVVLGAIRYDSLAPSPYSRRHVFSAKFTCIPYLFVYLCVGNKLVAGERVLHNGELRLGKNMFIISPWGRNRP